MKDNIISTCSTKLYCQHCKILIGQCKISEKFIGISEIMCQDCVEIKTTLLQQKENIIGKYRRTQWVDTKINKENKRK